MGFVVEGGNIVKHRQQLFSLSMQTLFLWIRLDPTAATKFVRSAVADPSTVKYSGVDNVTVLGTVSLLSRRR